MSLTTELAQCVPYDPRFCGSCARGLVLIPTGDGRHEVTQCPCVDPDPVEYPTEDSAPFPDPADPYSGAVPVGAAA